MLLEQFINRHPIDPSGLQGDGIDVAGDQPGDQSQQVRTKGAEHTRRLGITIGRHRDGDLISADIESGGVGVNSRQAIKVEGLGRAASGGIASCRECDEE